MFTANNFHSGLYYFRNRWYDPVSGRFLSKDPIGLDGGDLNLYVFCGNDPVNNLDPYGLTRERRILTSTEYYMGKIYNNGNPNEKQNSNYLSTKPTDPAAFKVNTAANANNAGARTARTPAANGNQPWRKLSENSSADFNKCPPESPVVDVTKLTLTKKVESHIDSRPYINSPLLAQEIMAVKPPIPDPQGVPGVLRWDVLGSYNNSQGTWEFVVDPSKNQVLHWLFQTQ